MKAYILKEEDFEDLFRYLALDPRRCETGSSSRALTKPEVDALEKAYSFYNYQVRNWADKVRK
jgi:hypothetical protein